MRGRAVSIDVGTNTIRLLIADRDGRKNLRRILTRRETTRLGEKFIENRMISFRAIERSIQVLREYVKISNMYTSEKPVAVATSAVREALNKDEFLERVYQYTGIEVRILSEEDEARVSLTGVLSVIENITDMTLVIDIGGGSVELIVTEGLAPITTHSLELGAVYLSERFIRADPPGSLELENLREFVDDRLSSIKKCIFKSQVGLSLCSLVGTAGTITALTAMDKKISPYDPDRINGSIVRRESVKGIYDRLRRLTASERKEIPCLEEGREDIILAGTVVVIGIMETFDFNDMLVSDSGLLEGIILEGKVDG